MRTVVLTCLLGLLIAAPVAQAAKTHKVDARGKITLNSSGVSIELRGKPFKHCRGFLVPTGPRKSVMTAKCTHGSVTVSTRETNASGSRGTWKLVTGSKRYRHAKASGRYSGSFVTFRIRFTGTIRF